MIFSGQIFSAPPQQNAFPYAYECGHIKTNLFIIWEEMILIMFTEGDMGQGFQTLFNFFPERKSL